ncbi:MAG: hypothetical protein HC853_11360, partial [Anaerolineae bacterium]|nr:hypothetical protein [Anaerolineae bacterium]
NLNASYSSILNATAAFFTAIVAAVWIKDPFTLRKALGVLLGMVGVAVLVGLNPVPLSFSSVASVGLILLATFSYGIAAVFAKNTARFHARSLHYMLVFQLILFGLSSSA